MKFMVELQVKPGSKNKALDVFDERGPNRNPGVALRGAWIANHADVVFALVESREEALVASAAQSWDQISEYRIVSVVDIEQF